MTVNQGHRRLFVSFVYKDLNAFRLVRRLTGHPTPEEMIRALRGVVDIYRPSFDEEGGRNALANTKLLWREIFGADIDVRKEIIEPAVAERRAVYEAIAADHRKEQLRRIAEEGEVGGESKESSR